MHYFEPVFLELSTYIHFLRDMEDIMEIKVKFSLYN